MKEDLLSGTTYIVDRYAFSGVAFTAAKQVMHVPIATHTPYNMYDNLTIPSPGLQSVACFGNGMIGGFSHAVCQVAVDWIMNIIKQCRLRKLGFMLMVGFILHLLDLRTFTCSAFPYCDYVIDCS